MASATDHPPTTPAPDEGARVPKQRDAKLVPWVYRLACVLTNAAFRLAFNADVRGLDRIPDEGPVLLVANHQSFLDPPVIGHRVRRFVTFLGRASLFNNPAFGWLIRSLNTIPIKDGEGDIAAIRLVLARLKRGECVLIFPEGSRTFDGKLQPLRDGATLMIRRAKCPVVPVTIAGAYDAWPRTRKSPVLFKGRAVQVQFGAPVPAADLLATDNPTAAMQALIEAQLRIAEDELRARTAGRAPKTPSF